MANHPKGIRFDPVKLKRVMDREGLASAQQVVNWFLEAYWWKTELNPFEGVGNAAGDAGKTALPRIGNGAAKPLVSVTVPLISQYEAYQEELHRANSIQEIEGINRIVQKDAALTPNQKKALEQFGKEISKELNV
jgi:hypothetical protein